MLLKAKKLVLAGFVSIAALSSYSNAATDIEAQKLPSISATEDLSSIVAQSPIAALSGGAWVSSGAGPTLTNKGILYQLTLPVVGTVPTGALITTVNYSWNLSTLPSGLSVYVCWDTTSYCVNVSANKNGSLANFSGRAANKKFLYVFTVSGSGTIFPVAYGQNDQVIVNYQ